MPRDVALDLQELAELLLDLGVRRDHLAVARHDAVADTREEIGDGISH